VPLQLWVPPFATHGGGVIDAGPRIPLQGSRF
jgi:hypothetical protein